MLEFDSLQVKISSIWTFLSVWLIFNHVNICSFTFTMLLVHLLFLDFFLFHLRTLTNTACFIFVSLDFVLYLNVFPQHSPPWAGTETLRFCTGSQLSSRIVLLILDLGTNNNQFNFSYFTMIHLLFVQHLKVALEGLKLKRSVQKSERSCQTTIKGKQGKNSICLFNTEINKSDYLPYQMKKEDILMHDVCLIFSIFFS